MPEKRDERCCCSTRKKLAFLLVLLLLGIFVSVSHMSTYNVTMGPSEYSPSPAVVREDTSQHVMRVLVWTPLMLSRHARTMSRLTIPMTECHQQEQLDCRFECVFTEDRQEVDRSDAILLRGRYLPRYPLPPKLPHQKWIFFEMEPPHKTWYFVNLTQYNGLFNLTSTYAWDSHIPIWPRKSCVRDEVKFKELENVNFASRKRNDVAVTWFASTCFTQSNRQDYVTELQKYIDVDVYGSCGDKTCLSNCEQVLLNGRNSYKFYLAFENSICEDYVTEKLWKVLELNVAVVVLGGVNYGDILPKDSFIDVRDYSSPKHLAKYLSYLNKNDDAYNAMMRRKASLRCSSIGGQPILGCSICQTLHRTRHQESVVHALDEFWGSRRCTPPELYHKKKPPSDFDFDLSKVKEPI